MSNYTPGPWILSPDQVRVLTGEDSNSRDIEIASCTGMDSGHPCPDRDEMKGNAKLIAAAPDMLSALKQVFQTRAPGFNFDFEYAPDMQAVIDAINKAER